MSSIIWPVVRWTFRLVPLLALAAVLHFYLPQHDVVRVVGTEVNRMDVSEKSDDGTAGGAVRTRDVRFINTVDQDGEPYVYRNEDTGFGFPWYFKFESGNLQAEAQNAISTQEAPRWVVITHYGWRFEIFSMFPNAVGIGTTEDPDAFIVPWFTIVFLGSLAILWFILWRAWRRFLERLEFDLRFENASNGATQVWRWIKANIHDLRGRPT